MRTDTSDPGLYEFANELRDATREELEPKDDDTPGDELLGAQRAQAYAAQELAARLELMTLELISHRSELEELVTELRLSREELAEAITGLALSLEASREDL